MKTRIFRQEPIIRPKRRAFVFETAATSVTFTVSAAINAISLSASLATAAPPSRTATLGAAIADIGLTGSVTTAAPASRTAAFLAAVASLGLTGSVTTASPASRTATLSAAITSIGLTASVTTATPGSILASLNAAIASLGLTGSLTTSAPGGVTASLSASIASVGLTSTITVSGGANLPDSLLEALAEFWTANNLNTAIAPLYSFAAPTGAVPPYLVADGFRQDLPGETQDDTPIEVYFVAITTSGPTARAIERSLGEWLESARILTPDTDPVVNPNRTEAFEWTVGYEKFCEPCETHIDVMPRLGVGGRQFRVRAHYTFWISGRP